MKTKFGFGQIFNPSPQWAINAFRFVLYLAVATAFVVGSISEIPDHIKAVILKYSLEVVGLTHGLSHMFGLDIGPDPSAK